MATFIEGVELESTTCAACGMLFAMPASIMSKRRNDHKDFYCPAGHTLVFSGPSEAEKLRKELERQREMTDAAKARADRAQRERDAAAKAHRKMRVRVANGVCPCCNRTFQNLLSHMRTQHPEFSNAQTLPALRKAFAMTQQAVADEAGVHPVHVSLFERGKSVAPYAARALESWVERRAAKETA